MCLFYFEVERIWLYSGIFGRQLQGPVLVNSGTWGMNGQNFFTLVRKRLGYVRKTGNWFHLWCDIHGLLKRKYSLKGCRDVWPKLQWSYCNALTKVSVTWWWIMGFHSKICRCSLLKMEKEGYAEVDLIM